jgi:hypothetical protein
MTPALKALTVASSDGRRVFVAVIARARGVSLEQAARRASAPGRLSTMIRGQPFATAAR